LKNQAQREFAREVREAQRECRRDGEIYHAMTGECYRRSDQTRKLELDLDAAAAAARCNDRQIYRNGGCRPDFRKLLSAECLHKALNEFLKTNQWKKGTGGIMTPEEAMDWITDRAATRHCGGILD